MEGGSCNDYDYVCGDPVNLFDLTGEKVGPHQAKHCGLPWNINKCRRSLKYRSIATSAAVAATAKYGLTAGETNAIRHAVYAALNAKNNGSGFTRSHLHAHEQDNDAWFTFGGNPCPTGSLSRDTAADKINNEIGISLGQGSKRSDKQLTADVTAAVVGRTRDFDTGSPCA